MHEPGPAEKFSPMRPHRKVQHLGLNTLTQPCKLTTSTTGKRSIRWTSMLYLSLLLILVIPAVLFLIAWIWAVSSNLRETYLCFQNKKKHYLAIEANIIDRCYIKNRFQFHRTSCVSTTSVYLLSYTHAGQTYKAQFLDTKEPHIKSIIDLSKNVGRLYIHRNNPSDAQFELKADFRYFHLGLGLILNAVTWVMISALIADLSR